MPENKEILKLMREQNEGIKKLGEIMAGPPSSSGMGVVSPADVSLPRTHDESGSALLDWQWLVFDVVVPANGTNFVANLISQEAHFHLMFMTGIATHPDNLQIKIKDSRSSNELEQQARWIWWNNLIGTAPAAGLSTANAPYTLGGFRRFSALTTITVELLDTSGEENTVQLAMHGIKEYVQYK